MSVYGFDPESNWPKRLVPGANVTFRDTGAELIIDSAGGGAGGGVSGGGTLNYVARWTGSTSLGSGVLYDNSSNVGISNTSPGYKLDIVAASPPVQLRFGVSASDDGGFLFSLNAGQTLLSVGAAHNGTLYVAKRTSATIVTLSDSTFQVQNNTNLTVGNTFTPTITFSVSPTQMSYTQVVATSGAPKAFTVIAGAHTTLTATAELIDVYFDLSRTVQWNAGAISTQRSVVFEPPTLAFVSSSTVTTAATVAILGAPAVGANATITTSLALWVQAGKVLIGNAPIFSNAVTQLEVTGTLTISGAGVLQAIGISYSGTLAVAANSDLFRGAVIQPIFAKSTFTGLGSISLFVGVGTPTGSGTIATHSTISISEATVATANVGLLIGTHPGGSTNYAVYINTTNSSVITGAGLQMGAPTGGDKGSGTINVATDIYKNNSLYNNPDYALEAWVNGGPIVKYADNPGARDYRRMTLGEVEQHIRQNYKLPGFAEDPMGIFERTDRVLEKIEELFTYMIEFDQRLAVLEQPVH